MDKTSSPTQEITISTDLYNRLAKHAQGFDETPENVIERILNAYEGIPSGKSVNSVHKGANNVSVPRVTGNIEIIYFPGGTSGADSELKFKEKFLEKKFAHIRIFYDDDRKPTDTTWHLNRFTKDSSVKGNLLSGRLVNWRKKGIVGAIVTTDRSDIE